MLAVLKVTLTHSGDFILKEAGRDLRFHDTIGPLVRAEEFYKLVAFRVAKLSHEGYRVKYIDECQDRTSHWRSPELGHRGA